MPFIIDGHNLLRSVQKSFEGQQGISQVHLCRLIDEFLRKKRSDAYLVFDGTGPVSKVDFEKLEHLTVGFSGEDKEADDVIEILISENSAPKRLYVISDDRRLKSAAKKRKANSVGCINFWLMVIGLLNKKPAIKEPYAKQEGISESETEKWLKEFGF